MKKTAITLNYSPLLAVIICETIISMRTRNFIIISSMLIIPAVSEATQPQHIAPTPTVLAESLLNTTGYNGKARFEVLLPSAEDPVVYDITLQSDAAPADTLSPASYIIRWSTTTPGGPLDGFSAYFDGNHYRYRGGNRLQEYHAATDPTPFRPRQNDNSNRYGVQTNAQFADMLPQMIGTRIHEIISSAEYEYCFHPDTIVGGNRSVVIDGVRRVSGYDAMTFTYVFNKNTLMPVRTDIVNNPGSISEQYVSIEYLSDSAAPSIGYNEDSLIGQWPGVFQNLRQSTFRTDGLINRPLPQFSCRMPGSADRLSHSSSEGFASPTLLVFIDPGVATAQSTVKEIRSACDMIPSSTSVIWVTADKHEDSLTTLLGQLRPDETALVSAGSLVRDCGIALFPTIILADRAGKVRDIISGFNKDLSSIVIQKTMLIQ